MQHVKKILKAQRKIDNMGNDYVLTTAEIQGDDEYDVEIATGWGTYEEGERVELFYDDRYHKTKFRKTRKAT